MIIFRGKKLEKKIIKFKMEITRLCCEIIEIFLSTDRAYREIEVFQ